MNRDRTLNLITDIRKLTTPKGEAAQKKLNDSRNYEIDKIFNVAFNDYDWGEVSAEELKKTFSEARRRFFDGFRPEDISNNMKSFTKAIVDRTKEILNKVEVDDMDLIERQNVLMLLIHETGATGKAADIIKLEKDKIVLKLMKKERNIKISFDKFQKIMNDCEKSFFGVDGMFFSLIEMKKGKELIETEFEKELEEALLKAEAEESTQTKTPEQEEAEEKVFQAKMKSKIDEDTARIAEIDAEQEKIKEQLGKMMTDALAAGDVETVNKIKAIQAEMLGYDEDIPLKAG